MSGKKAAVAMDRMPADLVKLAKAGQPDPTRILADWLEEHDRDADAQLLRILAFELESRTVQARQIRTVLSNARKLSPREADYTSVQNVRLALDWIGLPVDAFPISMGSRQGYLLVCPTDGEHEERTSAQLIELMKVVFPVAKKFIVEMRSDPMTKAGTHAVELLDAA